MSAGMAEVLIEHELTAAWLSVTAPSGFICQCGVRHSGTYPDLEPRAAYATHLEDELTKAGYGKVREAREDAFTDAVALLRDRGKWTRSEYGPYVVKTGYDEDGHGNAAQDVDEWYADWIEQFPYRGRKVEA